MNEQIKVDASRMPVVRIRDGEVFADSRDVAAYFGKEHKRVLQTIRELDCSVDFRRHHFVLREEIQSTSTGAVKHTIFDMTKDGFTFLVMGFTGGRAAQFKESYIAEFNAMEAELRARPAIPDLSDPKVLVALLTEHATKRIEAEQRAITAEKKVDEQRIDVEALDRISKSEGSMCVTDAAKTLQIKPALLFRWLRQHRWIYTRAGMASDIAHQDKINCGYLEHKTTTVSRSDGTEKTVTQVRVTSKGLARLAREFPQLFGLH